MLQQHPAAPAERFDHGGQYVRAAQYVWADPSGEEDRQAVPSRLSELLERIRPAGAPGAATEATTRREHDAAQEIAAVSVSLAKFAQEAEHEVAQAHARAAEILAEAEREAQRITADIPDRVAAAGSRAAAEVDPTAEAERTRLADDARRQVEALRTDAEARTDETVERTVSAIWAMVTPTGGVS